MISFQGDLLLTETPNGGDCVLTDGLISADHGLGTAFYISLFGGNKADSGRVKNNKTWWGNTLPGIKESEKIISRFQNFIQIMPMTVKNIKDAEGMASLDLKWAIDEKIIDKINVFIQSTGINRIRLFIEAVKKGNTIYQANYEVQWGAGSNGV